MEEDSGIDITELKVDGGASANDMLMQFQADMINGDVLRPSCIETTALGAAYLAGLATGFWRSREDIRNNWIIGQTFSPEVSEEYRKEKLDGWHHAVRQAMTK